MFFVTFGVILSVLVMDSVAGGSNNEEICFSRLTLVGFYRESDSNNDTDRMHYLRNKVQSALIVPDLSTDVKDLLCKIIYAYKLKFQKSGRHFERCIKIGLTRLYHFLSQTQNEKEVLDLVVVLLKTLKTVLNEQNVKKTEDIRKDSTPSELAFAAQMKYRVTGEADKSKLIKNISLGLTSVTKSEPHASYSPDQALSLLIDSQLSKYQYNLLRKSAMDHNCNLYPTYESVTEAKKRCYPEGILCTEIKASVPLQHLLDKTAERLLLSLKEVILNFTSDQRQNLCLISKWGCDGSGSRSQYKQKFQNVQSSDENMLVTSIVPIRLITTNNVLVWQIPRPSSPRFCRPSTLQMARETAELSRQEAANLRLQLAELLPTKTEDWCLKHELKLTMVDGKMINALTDTSSAMRCYLCGSTSKEFNKIQYCLKKEVKQENLEYGISSLHAWIRFAECILHLAYKLKLAKWQARGATDKDIAAAKKKRIQKDFLERLGLHVDKPRQGGGTSTDGNTARVMFRHAEETSEITGVNLKLINRLHTILKLLSCGYKIHIEKFKKFCLQTAATFVHDYPWFNVPTTLHKILIHGHEIIHNMGIAIGLFSEDAQESRNKDIRKYREQFSRKFSRKMAMEDTFHRLMVSSDPYISGLRNLTQKKNLSFSEAELCLLDENI